MSRHIIKLYALMLLSVSHILSATELDVFYPRHQAPAGVHIVDIALNDKCHQYLVKNSDTMIKYLNDILVLYKKRDWDGMSAIVNKGDYRLYLDNLTDCGNNYKFDGDMDYFREANTLLMFLNHIYMVSIKNQQESKSEVDTKTKSLTGYIKHIKNSKMKN